MDSPMDDRQLDQWVLLLYHIRHARVRAPTDDAQPCRFPAQRAVDLVEHHAGHVQPGRVRAHCARAVSRAQQIRSSPFGVRHQVSIVHACFVHSRALSLTPVTPIAARHRPAIQSFFSVNNPAIGTPVVWHRSFGLCHLQKPNQADYR